MRFSYKIKKLLSGQGLASARKHTRRFFHRTRFPLETKRVIETIDGPKFQEIRQRYSLENPVGDWPKYLDLDRWIDINIRRIREIELDLSRLKRILDLGCGAGYFLHIAQLLGVRRVVWRIHPLTPLPNFGERFDLITAFMICFNNHKQPNLWGVPEWEFFLNDLDNYLAPRGRVWLELNREYDETFYTPGLKDFFERRGARIDDYRVVFNSTLHAPASALTVGR